MFLKPHSESFKCTFPVICSGIPHLVCSFLFFFFSFSFWVEEERRKKCFNIMRWFSQERGAESMTLLQGLTSF